MLSLFRVFAIRVVSRLKAVARSVFRAFLQRVDLGLSEANVGKRLAQGAQLEVGVSQFADQLPHFVVERVASAGHRLKLPQSFGGFQPGHAPALPD